MACVVKGGTTLGKAKKAKEEVVQTEVVEEVVDNGVVVEAHVDRWDSGTNTNEAKPLPSLNDPGQ